MARIGQRITPFLWYDDNAEEAAKFYVSVFANSRIVAVSRFFTALNGGPTFKLNEAVSFVVNCDGQEEVDHYWNTLAAGGQEVECGWVKDKFGLSWQIIPTGLMEMLQDKDPAKSGRVMAAVMKMKKLDLPTLQRAYEGR